MRRIHIGLRQQSAGLKRGRVCRKRRRVVGGWRVVVMMMMMVMVSLNVARLPLTCGLAAL